MGVGQSVAQVYRDSQAQTNQADLEALADQIQLLEYSSDGGGVDSAAKLDENILQAVTALHAASGVSYPSTNVENTPDWGARTEDVEEEVCCFRAAYWLFRSLSFWLSSSAPRPLP